jgi:hypothetical protein
MKLRGHLAAGSPGLDESADALLQQLVRQALRRSVPLAVSVGAVDTFTSGTRAALVGRLGLTPTLGSVVVKVDSQDVTCEARHLRRTAEDGRLPAAFRRTLPTVYAIGSVDGPVALHGYLMEDLSDSHETLSKYLVDDRSPQVTAIVETLWEILEVAYAASRSTATVPNVEQLYIDTIVPGLELAATVEPRLAADRPIVIQTAAGRLELPPWGEVIARARRAAATWTPPFTTFAHGDLHAWNILVRPNGDTFDVRMIDLSDGVHDYVQDVARLTTSLRYLQVADGNGFLRPPRLATNAAGVTEITYDFAPMVPALVDAERVLTTRMAAFAADHDDDTATRRLQLAIASTLLALMPQLATGDDRWRGLALFAFAQGLQAMLAAAA